MIHVAIDARLPDQGQGGVQQVIRSLAEGFRMNESGDIRRSWIVLWGTKWWTDIFPEQDEIIFVKPPFGQISLVLANRAPSLVSRLFPVINMFKSKHPKLDKQLRSRGVNLVHMPFQDGFPTQIPYIYHPHDLQHKYFPDYFRKSQIKHRDSVWKQLATNASLVMAASPQTKEDLVQFWEIRKEKISVIPIPPPSRSIQGNSNNPYASFKYVIYPAVFWPHKNHENLVRAMKIVTSINNDIHCVFAGSSGSEFSKIKRLVRDLKLNDRVHFCGHIDDDKYGSILSGSLAMVIPSLFEAFSLTVLDAQNLDIPILCSDIPTFRFQCAEDVVYFDPLKPQQIAEAILVSIPSHDDLLSVSSNSIRQNRRFTPYKFASDMTEQYLLFSEGSNFKI